MVESVNGLISGELQIRLPRFILFKSGKGKFKLSEVNRNELEFKLSC